MQYGVQEVVPVQNLPTDAAEAWLYKHGEGSHAEPASAVQPKPRDAGETHTVHVIFHHIIGLT